MYPLFGSTADVQPSGSPFAISAAAATAATAASAAAASAAATSAATASAAATPIPAASAAAAASFIDSRNRSCSAPPGGEHAFTSFRSSFQSAPLPLPPTPPSATRMRSPGAVRLQIVDPVARSTTRQFGGTRSIASAPALPDPRSIASWPRSACTLACPVR